MNLYDCKVRLAGNLVNEVRKTKIPAAEVICLKMVHGDDAVVEIKPNGTTRQEHEMVRQRLAEQYGKALGDAFPRTFPPYAALMEKLPKSVFDDGSEDEQPKRRGRPPQERKDIDHASVVD